MADPKHVSVRHKLTPLYLLLLASIAEFCTRISFRGWIILAIACGLTAWGAASLIPQWQCDWADRCWKR